MDNTSLRQIIEFIPELKFRYIGSFPADCIPSLPIFSFAIIKSSPSSEAGEQWIMLAWLNRTYYYADFLDRQITQYNFLNKNCQKMIQRPLQKTDISCAFYTICEAFQLFRFLQTKLKNVYDVHVLVFISNNL